MKILKLLDKYGKLTENFSIFDYEPHGKNICLIHNNDIMLFEFIKEGIYRGHYFFESRGKDAVTSIKKLVNEFFSREDTKLIQGITPLEQKGARWITRQMGATSYGIIPTIHGECELFLITKDEWRRKWDS